MEPRPGGDIEVEVGVVHAVQPPERGHGMEHHMLKIDCQIENDDRERDFEPEWQFDEIEKAPAPAFGNDGQRDRHQRDEKPHQRRVQRRQAQIGIPAQPARLRQPPARPGKLPQGHKDKNAEEEPQPDRRFASLAKLRHSSTSTSGCPSGRPHITTHALHAI